MMLNNQNLISSIQFDANESILTFIRSFTSHFVWNKNGKEYWIYVVHFTNYATKQVNFLQNNGNQVSTRLPTQPILYVTIARFDNED